MELNENQHRGESFIKIMESFPCLFNVPIMQNQSRFRLQFLLVKLEQEQENAGDEKALLLDMRCWIYFQLGNMKRAKEMNDESLRLSPERLVSLGNYAFLGWYSFIDISTVVERLGNIKTESSYPMNEIEARAGQAYFLLRLGGQCNLSAAANMYTVLIQEQPENCWWKYRMGLSYRRISTMRRSEVTTKCKEIFTDVAEKTEDELLKSLALAEMAVLLSYNDNISVKDIEHLTNQALKFGDSRFVIRNCALALKNKMNPEGISLLERATSPSSNPVSHHFLGKWLKNFQLTKNMDRKECDRKALYHLNKSDELSMGTNFEALFDLALFLKSRKMKEEAMEKYDNLTQNWAFRRVLHNPFYLAKVMQDWYYLAKTSPRFEGDPMLRRYLTMALSTTLMFFKSSVSPEDKIRVLRHIAEPGLVRISEKNSQILIDLLERHEFIKNIVTRLIRSDELIKQAVTKKIEDLLVEDRPDEALLVIDFLDIDENNSSLVSDELRCHALLEEAKWELSHGYSACKLLFQRIFNICHKSESRIALFPDEEEREMPEVDIVIFHDSPQWRHFLQDNAGERRDSTKCIRHCRLYEEMIENTFDLEVLPGNPFTLLSKESMNNASEFSTLVEQYQIKLVLLLTDDNTSDEFLHLANMFLAPIYQGVTPGAESAPRARTGKVDVGVIWGDGRDVSAQLPNLGGARHFDARHNGICQPEGEDQRRMEDLSGTKVLDAYFSGDVENALNFFKFLSPVSQY